ncbi:MAG: hypothetical protein MK179_03060 [Pirellulaceae bacterium]|nr:hypothetical protein [Pirellulaceae bacterium]
MSQASSTVFFSKYQQPAGTSRASGSGSRATRRVPLFIMLCTVLFGQTAWGGRPSEDLLPDSTKFCILIPDLKELRDNFNKTQLGRMTNDPLMKPFVDDLRRQLQERIDEEGRSVGLTWEDVDRIDGGEICFARVQPGGDEKQEATIVIVDVSDHQEEAQQVIEKVHAKQLELGASFSQELVRGTDTQLRIYTFPLEKGEVVAEQRVLFLHADQLFGVNHKQAAISLRNRCDGGHVDRLSDVEAYQGAMQRVAAEYEKYGDPDPHVRWFLEPYGVAQIRRVAKGGDKQRGTDMLTVWNDTGFREAIKGAGGFVNFAHQGRDVLHRSLVYAPPVQRAADDKETTKYNSAARMLAFPNTNDLLPEPWIPRELASFATFNWKIKEASVYVAPLVDAILGGEDGEGTYTDIKESLRDDEDGPQVDVDKDFFAHLDERFVWVTDYEVPISTTSERVLFAVRTTDPAKLAATIQKTMATDENAILKKIGNYDVWEIDETGQEGVEDPDVKLGDEEDDDLPFLFGDDDEGDLEEEPLQPLFPYRLVTVAHGCMITATNRDLMESVLRDHAVHEQLESSTDYVLITKDLEQLGAGEDSLRIFSRLDEQLRPTYELIKQGLMPQSETLFGKFLNWYFGSTNDEPREQIIDGKEMPGYQVARRYLGPTGLYIQTEKEGWFVVGSVVPQDDPATTARVADESAKAP